MIEMLIAIVLATVVLGAAVSLFLANKNTSSTTAAMSAISDNGRVALSFIGESVRSGGYMACNATNDIRSAVAAAGVTRQLNILQAGATPVQRNYTEAFGGYEAGNTAVPGVATVLPPPVAADGNAGDWLSGAGGLDGLLVGQVVKGSDVLVVRQSVPQDIPVYSNANYNAGQNVISVYSVGNLQPGQYAVISDCSVSTAFQIGAVNGGANTISTAGALDQFGGNLQWSYGPPAAITPVDMAIYYIGVGRDNDSALFVYHESTGLFQELVPDVENMQVLFGVAPTTPNQVTEYVQAQRVVDFNQVVSVKVALLVASPVGAAAVPIPAAAPTYNLLGVVVTVPADTRLRKVFESTITVRSAAL
jgi:type IV pilus assembly protein PilW